jgi:hypothetical protein
MKISAIASGGAPGTDLAGVNIGRTASPQKLAAAKAIAMGETPPPQEPESEVEKLKQSVRKITMKTNASPERYAETTEPAPVDSAKADIVEQGNVPEVTQPITPQLAALAKQRRALQVKERELADREKALQSAPTTDGGADLIARLKSKPLSVLQEYGVTYDQLTEAILADSSGLNPEIQALRAELKALKEGVDNTFKTQEESQVEAALTEMLYEAEALAKEGDTYELIRDADAYGEVLRRIYSAYKKTGRVLNVVDVMNKVENEILERRLKQSKAKKVQEKLALAHQPVQTPQLAQKQMRTLTSRDGATPPLDRRARAFAAFHGTLKG